MSSWLLAVLCWAIMTAVVVSKTPKTLTEANSENCEVCVSFVTRFIESLDKDTKTSIEKIENAFRKFCKNTKKDDNRFCYYVGGLEESATGMLGEIARPVSYSMPPDKICFKLYKRDGQICDLKYEKSIDLATVNLKKLKVNDLKNILGDWDERCRGCTEKSDYIRLIEQVMPKYAPEAHKKRQEMAKEDL